MKASTPTIASHEERVVDSRCHPHRRHTIIDGDADEKQRQQAMSARASARPVDVVVYKRSAVAYFLVCRRGLVLSAYAECALYEEKLLAMGGVVARARRFRVGRPAILNLACARARRLIYSCDQHAVITKIMRVGATTCRVLENRAQLCVRARF